jgi:hypothetical protein
MDCQEWIRLIYDCGNFRQQMEEKGTTNKWLRNNRIKSIDVQFPQVFRKAI